MSPLNIFHSCLFVAYISAGSYAQEQYEYSALDGPDGTEELTQRLEENPEDLKSNYNLAVHYYNAGVHILENMDFDQSFNVLEREQKDVLVLFEKSFTHSVKDL